MFRKETEFQETEIGDFPKDWEVRRLNEIAELQRGLSYSGREKSKDEIPDGYLFLTLNSIKEGGGLKENGWMWIKSDRLKERHFVKEGDLVIANTEQSKDGSLIGSPAIVHFPKWYTKDKAVFSMDLSKLLLKVSNVDVNFLFYYLSFVQPIARKYHTGTNVWHLNLDSWAKDLLIPLPPLDEQKRIAGVLSIIDGGIESVDRAIAKLERMKKALLNGLLTGRIRVREENGKLTFYKETEFQDTQIGKIPKDWKLVKLSNIVEDIYYGITAKAVEHKTGLKILRTTDIKDYNVDWDLLPFCEITEKRGNIQRFLLKKGDIIIARAGTTGVCVLVEKDFEDVIFGSYLIKIRLNKNVYPRFVYYFCQSHSYWNQITSGQAGSTIKNINIPLLKSLNVPLPSSVKEQTAITEILSTVDKAIELYRREKERLLRLKRGLMSVLLTGRVRVVSDVRDVEVNV